MRIAVFGAGAIGGHLAARLGQVADDDLSVVARGAQLDAIRESGLVLRDGTDVYRIDDVVATDDPWELPRQDVVFVTLKAWALPEAADALDAMLAPGGCAVFFANGIPWWWNHGLGDAAHASLPLLDPGGRLWLRLRERTLGGVVYSANRVVEPGVVVHTGRDAWIVGEPDGSDTPRLRRIHALLTAAGLAARTSSDLRREVWKKLVFNASANPLSALTRRLPGQLAADAELRALVVAIRREIIATAAALRWQLGGEVDPAAFPAPATAGVRPSMLQDVEAGRRLEVDAILGQAHEFARSRGIATPALDIVLPLLRGLDATLAQTSAGPSP